MFHNSKAIPIETISMKKFLSMHKYTTFSPKVKKSGKNAKTDNKKTAPSTTTKDGFIYCIFIYRAFVGLPLVLFALTQIID